MKLAIKKVIGDVRLMPGYSPVVMIESLGLSNYMMIQKAKHVFKNSEHLVDLTVVGGEYNVT